MNEEAVFNNAFLSHLTNNGFEKEAVFFILIIDEFISDDTYLIFPLVLTISSSLFKFLTLVIFCFYHFLSLALSLYAFLLIDRYFSLTLFVYHCIFLTLYLEISICMHMPPSLSLSLFLLISAFVLSMSVPV